jgi:uncharacterized lipoprotein YmbA
VRPLVRGGRTQPIRTGRLRFAALLSIAGWLASGCLGTSPTPRFYTLNAVGVSVDAVSGAEPLWIGVGPIHLPRYLQRPQIVTRSGDHRLKYHERHRWGGSLESEALRVLGSNLSALLETDQVFVYPLQGTFRLDYRVRMNVEQFDGELGGEMRLRVRWVIGPGDGGEVFSVGYSNLQQPIGSSSYGDLVRAHGVLLATFSRELATRIRALEEAEIASQTNAAEPGEVADPPE